jgi:hypothetical protein
MQKLKLSALPDDKPVKLTVELPAAVHRDLVAYAEVLGRVTDGAVKPAKLVAPTRRSENMISRQSLVD